MKIVKTAKNTRFCRSTGFYRVLLVCLVGLVGLVEPGLAQENGPPDNRPPDNRPPGQSGEGGDANAEAAADALSEAIAGAEANASVTVNIAPDALSGAQAAQTTQSLTVNEAERPDEITIKNTPATVAPDILPTVSCFKGASGSLALPGFGGSFGAGKIDEDCVKREYIRLGYAMGAVARAMWMWCHQPAVWNDFGTVDDCLLFEANKAELEAPGSGPAGNTRETDPEPLLMAQNYVEEEVLEEEVLEPLQKQQQIIEAQEARLQALERRLEAQAAAARRAQQQREAFKAELTDKYLTDNEAQEEEPSDQESENE